MPTKSPESHARGFTGVWIPAEIWEDIRLTWFERCLWAQIKSFTSKGKPCTASTQFLADQAGTTYHTVANALAVLRKHGLIKDVGTRDERKMFAIYEQHATEDPLNPEVQPIEPRGSMPLNPEVQCPPPPNIVLDSSLDTSIEGKVDGSSARPLILKLQKTLAIAFGRHPEAAWQYEEQRLLCELARRPGVEEECNNILRWKGTTNRPPESVLSVLSRWTHFLDRSRNATKQEPAKRMPPTREDYLRSWKPKTPTKSL